VENGGANWQFALTSRRDIHSFRASQRYMNAPQKIDRIYKIYRIDFHPPHLVHLVNPVYFLYLSVA
jgi:hypothetical protein